LHVRSSNASLITLIARGSEQSATFRRLIDAIDASDGIVYVEAGRCRYSRACLTGVSAAGTYRMLWVTVDTRRIDSELIASIGHELQHAIEILSNPNVRNTAAMYLFYSRFARRVGTGRGAFETTAATKAGNTVREEIRAFESRMKGNDVCAAIDDHDPALPVAAGANRTASPTVLPRLTNAVPVAGYPYVRLPKGPAAGVTIDFGTFGDFLSAVAVEHAVQGAARRLASPSCALILSDFEDRPGRTLSMRLDANRMSLTQHIAALWFVDASRSSRCQATVLAFTKAGSYTIEICALVFNRLFDRERRLAELIIIHELLHSLGLGENPPTDGAINARVATRCG
jgi:hypothetical protein